MTRRVVIAGSPRRKPGPVPVDLDHMRAVRRFVARYTELMARRDNAKGENALLDVIAEMQQLERTVRFVLDGRSA